MTTTQANGSPKRRGRPFSHRPPEKLRIDPEFQALCPPLSKEELDDLEKSLLAQGCLEPLWLWQEKGWLLDGHNRYALCHKHGLPFHVKKVRLPDREAAKAFIREHQLARRNLTPEGASYLRGQHYLARKAQGQRSDLTSGQTAQKSTTAQALAQPYHVDEKTIRRDARFARDVERVTAACGAEARGLILTRDVRLTRKDVAELALLGPREMRERFAELRQGRPRKAADVNQVWLRVPAEPGPLAEVVLRKLGTEKAATLCQELLAALAAQGLKVAVTGPTAP